MEQRWNLTNFRTERLNPGSPQQHPADEEAMRAAHRREVGSEEVQELAAVAQVARSTSPTSVLTSHNLC